MRELVILSSVRHRNILRYKESWVENRVISNMVVEYAAFGDLLTQIKAKIHYSSHFSEENLQDILVQLASCLDYLHSNGIAHRDIKSNNIFVAADGCLKLGDFGLASLIDEDQLSNTVVGTLPYMSPEILRKKPYSAFESDLWALGCVMWELTALKPAFASFNAEGLMRRISSGPAPTLPAHLPYSDTWKSLVQSMLSKDTNQRPSLSELLSNQYLAESKERVQLRYGPPLPPGSRPNIVLAALPQDLAKLADFFKHQELEADLKVAEEQMKKKESQLRYAPEALKGRLKEERDEAAKALDRVKSRVDKELNNVEVESNLIDFPNLQREFIRKARAIAGSSPSVPDVQLRRSTMRRSEPSLQLPSLKQSPGAPPQLLKRHSFARISLDPQQHLNPNHASPAREALGLPPKPPGQVAMPKTPRSKQAPVGSVPVIRKHSHDGRHLPSITPKKNGTPEKATKPQRRQTFDALMQEAES